MSEEHINELQGRIAELEDQLSALREELRDNQLDLWKARIDDLEVQLRLGQMEARDDVAPVLDKLRNLLLDARGQVDSASTSARDALRALADGVKDATDRLRNSINDAGSALRG